jgi:hypothetical protein
MLGWYAFAQTPGTDLRPPRDSDAPAKENWLMSRQRDRVVRTAGARGELTLYELDRATEIKRAGSLPDTIRVRAHPPEVSAS